ncbi:MAG: pilin [Patescibacteria group bacterium]
MRMIFALGIAMVLFFTGAHKVLAAAGTGPIGSKCGDTNTRYTGSPVTAGLDFSISTCQTMQYCIDHAPQKGFKPHLYYWDPQNPDCSNAQQDPGGCCAYFLQPKPTYGKPPADLDVFNPLVGIKNIYDLIRRAITIFLGMVGALAFAVFFYSGIVWMTADSSDRINTAKAAMKYAVIGLLLIGFSFAITNFIVDALVNKGSFAAPATTAPATPQQLQ